MTAAARAKLPLAIGLLLVAATLAWWWGRRAEAVAAPPIGVDPAPAGTVPAATVPVSAPRELPPVAASAAPVAGEVPPPYAEFDDAEWRPALTEAVPDGAVHAVVVRGKQRLAGALVRLFAGGDAAAEAARSGVGAAVAQARTDADGVVRFAGAAADGLALRADADGDHVARVNLDRDPSLQRTVVLALGRAEIVGGVRDDRAVPAAGLRVTVSGLGPLPRLATTTSDRDGRFRVGGLLGGRYQVMVDQRAAQFDPSDQRQVTLPVAGRVEVGFGPRPDDARWHGHLIDAAGDVVPGARRLQLVGVLGDERHLEVLPDGRFDLRLPPGDWQVRGDGGLFAGAPAETVALPRFGLQHDVVVPGVRIVFAIAVEGGSDADLDGVAGQLWLDGPGVSARQAEGLFAAPGGPFVQWLVERPGAYRLRAPNHLRLVAANERLLPFEVAPGQRVFRGEVFVR